MLNQKGFVPIFIPLIIIVVILTIGAIFFIVNKVSNPIQQSQAENKDNLYSFLPKEAPSITTIPNTAYIRLTSYSGKIETLDLATNEIRTIASIGPDLVDTATSSADYRYGNYLPGGTWKSYIRLIPLKKIGKILAYYSVGNRLWDDYRALGIVMYDYATGKTDVLYQTRQFPSVNGLKPENYNVFYDQDSNQIFVLSSFGQFNDSSNYPAISGYTVYRLSKNKTLDQYGSKLNILANPLEVELSFRGKNGNNKLIINDPQSDYFMTFQSRITDTFDKAISKIKTQRAYLVDASLPSIQEATITPKDLPLIDKKYYPIDISEATTCGELSIRVSSLPFNVETNNIEKPDGDYFFHLLGYSTKLKSFFYYLEGTAKNELAMVSQSKNLQESNGACDKYFAAQMPNKYMIYSTKDKSSKVISKDELTKQYLPDMDTQMDVSSLINNSQ